MKEIDWVSQGVLTIIGLALAGFIASCIGIVIRIWEIQASTQGKINAYLTVASISLLVIGLALGVLMILMED